MGRRQLILDFINPLLAQVGLRMTSASTYRSKSPVPLDTTVDLKSLAGTLSTPLELAILGSIDDNFFVPDNLENHVRIFSLDAISPAGGTQPKHRVIPLRQVVAAEAGSVTFFERSVAGVSSTLVPRAELINDYGLHGLYELKQKHRTISTTLPDIATHHGVHQWDYIRTDLEGADFSIIKSLGNSIEDTSLVEMELRCEPFYETEPYFHDVLSYMARHGFEILDLKPERWRANTEHMIYDTRGRVTFCNTVFVNQSRNASSPASILRSSLVLGLMGYANHAERCLRQIASSHADQVGALLALFYRKARKKYLPLPGMPHVTHGTGD